MKLQELSITNYRSITKAHKIKFSNMTVLVGKNNEGKSNILRGLNVAMNAIVYYGRNIRIVRRDDFYRWERDFPVQFQSRKSNLESVFRLTFQLNDEETKQMHKSIKVRGNGEVVIEVRIGKDNKPEIKVSKRGSSSYNEKSKDITNFISKLIRFNYIQAVRTENMALNGLQDAIIDRLSALDDNPEYKDARQKIAKLEQAELDVIARGLISPLRVFLPHLNSVSITGPQDPHYYRRPFLRDYDVMIDDGNNTSIRDKGDGIKSLVTLAILNNANNYSGASVVAIEEPESHLHPGAIHNLVEVIHALSQNSQVIITTHNPLFVYQNRINSNVIVDNGTAHVAKSIYEIRETLGVWPSDNLRDAQYVLVVEGENDKVALFKNLSKSSETIRQAFINNSFTIKPLLGAGNLSHDLAELKNNMCSYIVLLDNDDAGREAANIAMSAGLLNPTQLRYTIVLGSKNSEFEDCINPDIYKKQIKEEYMVNLDGKYFHTNKQWSERMRMTFQHQGILWNEEVEKKVKILVSSCVSESECDISKVLINEKSGFITSLIESIEKMLDNESDEN